MNNIHRISAIALALAVAPAAWSATGQKPTSQAQQQYQQDRAYCTSGQATEDRATCLKEAAAAYAEARGAGSHTKAMGAGPAKGKKAVHKAKVKTQAKAKTKTEEK